MVERQQKRFSVFAVQAARLALVYYITGSLLALWLSRGENNG